MLAVSSCDLSPSDVINYPLVRIANGLFFNATQSVRTKLHAELSGLAGMKVREDGPVLLTRIGAMPYVFEDC